MLSFKGINKAEVWTASYCARTEIYKFILMRLVLAWSFGNGDFMDLNILHYSWKYSFFTGFVKEPFCFTTKDH